MRLGVWFRAWLVALDQLVYVTLAAPKYLLRGGPCPSPYETISSKCGRMARKGHRWAIIAQCVIDRVFVALGSQPGHCARSIVRADLLDWR